ncbi:MAG TPA: xanthine dehydrogenase family protein molybdopterin-binding subunit, partial [Fibrella sp.]
MAYIGQPVKRVDGKDKVTGKAKYAAEFNVPGLSYGYVLSSTIVKGSITSIDASAALALPGVLQVFTHENRPHTAWFDMNYKDQDAPP